MITTRQKLTRYSASLAVVLGVHALAIALALNWTSRPPIELPPQAMMVELAPVPAPPPPAPPKVITPPQPPAPVEELPIPKLAEVPKAEIAVPKPVKPKPKPQPPKPVEKKPEPPKEKPSEEKPSDAQPTQAPTEKSAQPAPGPSAAQQAAKASWQGELLAHLAKYKKYASAQMRNKEGMNRLRFVVDAEGNVLSFELVGGSGKPDLDRATLEIIRRAQPLPKPPADMLTNGTIEIVAPFVYSLEKRRR